MSERREESRAFCPQCGEPVSPDAADRGAGSRRERALCDECYFERHDLVDAPDRVTITLCSNCGAAKVDDEWTDVGDQDYTAVAVEAVRDALGIHAEAEDVAWTIEPEQVDTTTLRMHCTFSGTIRGTYFEESVTVPVTLPRGTCSRCGRIAGGDHAAIVQVRARDRSPAEEERQRAVDTADEHVTEHAEQGDRDAFVSEVEESPDGVDMKLSTTALGRAIAYDLTRQLGGHVDDSQTLVSEDEEGNPVYRMTYAVHLPPFRPGDVIDPGDGEGPVLVRSAVGNLKGVRLTTGDPYEAAHEAGDAPEADRLGRREDAVETTVVAVEDDRAIQVLDPETYEAVTVARPEYVPDDAETVSVLRSRAGLHVLPPEGAERASDRPRDGDAGRDGGR